MPPDPEVTLKEFMDVRLEATEEKFDGRFNALEAKVDKLEGKVQDLEDCITNDVKHAIKAWKYIGGLIMVIVTALVVAWLQQRLGL